MSTPQPLRPEDIPLSLLAELRLAATENYDLGISLEPLLRRLPAFATRFAELDALEQRYACWQLDALALEVEEGAPELADELVRWPYRTALEAVKGDDEDALAYARWTTIFRLLEASLEVTPRQPERGRELATLARHCLAQLDDGYGPYDGDLLGELEALVWAHLGNSHRVPRDLKGAARCFAKVRRLLKKCRAGMPGLRGMSLLMTGAFHRDQRQFEPARAALEAALQLSSSGKAESVRVMSTMNLASLDFEQGDAEAAVARMQDLLARLDAAEHPRYSAEAHFNLAYYLAKLQRYDDAAGHLQASRAWVLQHEPAHIRARFFWVEGDVVRGNGDLAAALAGYAKSRELLLEGGIAYEAAIVGLEMTALLLQLGRAREAGDLARELIPVFEDLDIEREAGAAVELFRRAAAQEQLTQVVTHQLLTVLTQRR